MKFLFDFFPILLFFGVYQFYGIYAATAAIMVATVVQISLFWLRFRRVEKMHLWMLGIVMVAGGATLFFQNPLFIKWKPTIAYWLFALILFGSHFIGDRSLIERMLGHVMQTSQRVWHSMNFSWGLFFLAMGVVNLYVAYNYPEDIWVKFKLISVFAPMVFAVGQMLVAYRFLEEKPSTEQKS